ncbi:MAG: ADP-heptose--LPS heptosyltransferase [Bryobacteraceae bacterium]
MSEEHTSGHCIQSAREALDEMRVQDALRLFKEAERRGYDPDICAAGRWTCHMLRGEFKAAWEESDDIERRGRPDPHRFWDGTPFGGKHVMIRCLHGLGDTIQFIRFAPAIREQAAALTVEAQPGLKTLLAQTGIADHVITWGEPEPYWNQQIEVNELPRAFRVTETTIPRSPYLSVVKPRRRGFRAGSDTLNVGLVWSASIYNPLRSIRLEELAPLFRSPGFSFFSLQAGSACEEIRPWTGVVENLSEHAADVLETAENMLAMDLVITVDTMAAHLAGALGVPTWTLLPFACDWRWMTKRSDSPWYASMRLFRQERPGEWAPVVRRLARALETLYDDELSSSQATQSIR